MTLVDHAILREYVDLLQLVSHARLRAVTEAVSNSQCSVPWNSIGEGQDTHVVLQLIVCAFSSGTYVPLRFPSVLTP